MTLFETVENILAQQILSRWKDDPVMLKKAIMAAGAAARGEPQDLFPMELGFDRNFYLKLADLLQRHVR